ncbi:MAG: dihydropteroate synthase [Deltaproteobacteria bacterium RIFCSPLOWO2_12_FULL_57_22]|nr:MAG: dihydropteroate synthase [Deltaproteobacteria bacterium RIFCSPLOWO2_12_FULL_57_22]
MTRHGDIDFERRTALVGVLNVTPDSFSDGGRYLDPENAIARGVKLAEEGADLIDIGGESSRPGARPVSAEEELERVVPVIRGLRRALSVPLSIDTYKARVARVAIEEGVDVVNDISAMRFDPEMVRVIAAAKVPVVLMHMQGTPRTMQERPYYRDVVEEVKGFLQERIEFALESGVGPEQILVDPGIGFGKELEHNLALLRGLPALASLGRPILVGPSRKTFIGKILGVGPEERLEGSLAAAVAAVLAGANMIRIHDVREARRAIGIADALRYGSVHG